MPPLLVPGNPLFSRRLSCANVQLDSMSVSTSESIHVVQPDLLQPLSTQWSPVYLFSSCSCWEDVKIVSHHSPLGYPNLPTSLSKESLFPLLGLAGQTSRMRTLITSDGDTSSLQWFPIIKCFTFVFSPSWGEDWDTQRLACCLSRQGTGSGVQLNSSGKLYWSRKF